MNHSTQTEMGCLTQSYRLPNDTLKVKQSRVVRFKKFYRKLTISNFTDKETVEFDRNYLLILRKLKKNIQRFKNHKKYHLNYAMSAYQVGNYSII